MKQLKKGKYAREPCARELQSQRAVEPGRARPKNIEGSKSRDR